MRAGKIWKTLHARGSECPHGFVRVRGKANSEQVLSSPVGYSLCCLYKVEIDQWTGSGKSHSWQHCCWLPFLSGGRDWDGSDGRARSGVRPSRGPNPRGQFLPGDGCFGASHGEWRPQRRRSVAICELRAQRGVAERVGQFIDKRIEKTGAPANPQVQAKAEALKELFAALPAMAPGGQPSTDVMAKSTAASGPLSPARISGAVGQESLISGKCGENSAAAALPTLA